MPFSEKKVTQVAGLLLNLAGGDDYLLRLMKMLYIADRRAIAQWGFFISDDRHVSMKFGPVLSDTYNLMKDPRRTGFWGSYISPRFGPDSKLRLLQPVPTDALSRAEEKMLREVHQEYGNTNRFELSEMTHRDFPEWNDPAGSSTPISVREMLRAQAVPEIEIRQILRDLRRSENAESTLATFG